MSNEIEYFSDLKFFIKFLFNHKLIIFLSIIFFIIITMFVYSLNYSKYENNIKNFALLEIHKSKFEKSVSFNDLKSIVKFPPFDILLSEQYNIQFILNYLNNDLKDFFDENKISYTQINKSPELLSFEIEIKDKKINDLISKTEISNLFKISKNKFTANIEEQIDNIYEMWLRDIYHNVLNPQNYQVRLTYSFLKKMYRQMGGKYTRHELCELDKPKKFDFPSITYLCNHDYLSSNKSTSKVCSTLVEDSCLPPLLNATDNKCFMQSYNIRVRDFVRGLVITDADCRDGIFIDKNLFKPLFIYIDKINNNKLINYNYSSFEKTLIKKPRIQVYIFTSLIFGLFFGIILSFIMRVIKS